MRPQRLGQRVGDRQTARGDAQAAQTLAIMREIWGLTQGFFPGRSMPVPRFTKGTTNGAVGWYPGRDGPTPIGVRFDQSVQKELLGLDNGHRIWRKPERQAAFSSAVRTLLHEWAHNFQKPQNYGDRALIEAGAEAFAQRVAPRIVRQMGRRYRRGISPYPTRVAVERGVPYIVKDQFAQP